MAKGFIFISCGQFTEAEKTLGKQIAQMVRDLTQFQPFFAEEVHDLLGLNTKILHALRDCVALIVVMHPRGRIERPDGSVLTRASVWIEQEIAIATYIRHAEGRELPIIAFKHRSVDREGIRDLISLNPIPFTDENQILEALPKQLAPWKSLSPSGIQIQLQSLKGHVQDDHVIRLLRLTVINGTHRRIASYTCEIWVPAVLFKHWHAIRHYGEIQSDRVGYQRFRYTEADRGSAGPRVVEPRDKMVLATFEYCTRCAADSSDFPSSVGEKVIEAVLWVDEREYPIKRTVKELCSDAESRVEY